VSGAAKERARLRVPIDRADPQAMTAWIHGLRPLVADIRGLAEEATLPPAHRRYARVFLRRRLLRAVLAMEARLEAVAD
jgi:hypothetical protein